MEKEYFVFKDKFIDEPELEVVFDNKKAAEEYCKLMNLHYGSDKYYFDEHVKYESLNDFAKNNQNKYVEMLENAIVSLDNYIYRIEDNQEIFLVKLKGNRVHKTAFYIIKSIVDNGPLKLNRTIYQNNKEIKITAADYPAYVAVYKNIVKTLKEIQKYKRLINKHKKHVVLLNSEKNLEDIKAKLEDKTLYIKTS